jgi:phosphoglycolate phosphatase
MDNTLYDWVAYFVPAVRAMLRQAAPLLDIDEESLREDLRRVHVERGNTEHPFALLETQSVEKRLAGFDRRRRHEFLRPAFTAFDEVRNQRLRLYPDVAAALKSIRETGCLVVGHTEATDVNITSRARSLGLQYVLDTIYAPKFTGPPHPVGARVHNANPVVISLPSGARKPDPEVARQIAERVDTPTEHCLYVGDSLAKDIAMAKHAGMQAAWARYGTQHDPELWRELVSLSHWDGTRVAEAESTVAPAEPDVVLESFGDVLQHFSFSARPTAQQTRAARPG